MFKMYITNAKFSANFKTNKINIKRHSCVVLPLSRPATWEIREGIDFREGLSPENIVGSHVVVASVLIF